MAHLNTLLHTIPAGITRSPARITQFLGHVQHKCEKRVSFCEKESVFELERGFEQDIALHERGFALIWRLRERGFAL